MSYRDLAVERHGLTMKEVRLGRLVKNIREPSHLPLDIPYPEDQVNENPVQDYDKTFYTSRNQSLSLKLCKFLGINQDNDYSSNLHVVAKVVQTTTLLDPDTIFNDSLASTAPSDDVAKRRLWLQNRLQEGANAHMIVGYRTFTDVTVEKTRYREASASGEGSIPIADMHGAAVVPSTALDISVAVAASIACGDKSSFKILGCRIVAVLYRKVQLRRSRISKNLEPGLKDEKIQRWEWFIDVRKDNEDDTRPRIGVEVLLAAQVEALESLLRTESGLEIIGGSGFDDQSDEDEDEDEIEINMIGNVELVC